MNIEKYDKVGEVYKMSQIHLWPQYIMFVC